MLVPDEHTAAAIRAALPSAEVYAVSGSEGLAAAIVADPGALVVLPVSAPAERADVRRTRLALGVAAPVVVLLGEVGPGTLDAIESGEADDVVEPDLGAAVLGQRLRTALRRGAAIRALIERVGGLERLVAQQSEYLSAAAHEIRTPLSAILSSASILRRYGGSRPESVERFAQLILEEGRRLTRLINDLLDLAKIEANQADWSFAPTRLGALVENVKESFAALAAERSIAVESACDPADAVVWADPDRLKQVLVNLVSNAINHSPAQGSVRLDASVSRECVRVAVTDEGNGIPPGEEERVFARFHQLSSGEEPRGTGLGLAIAREIVERHRGRIWAERGRQRGACFVLELPADEGSHGSV